MGRLPAAWTLTLGEARRVCARRLVVLWDPVAPEGRRSGCSSQLHHLPDQPHFPRCYGIRLLAVHAVLLRHPLGAGDRRKRALAEG
jgi:hypothetical protein